MKILIFPLAVAITVLTCCNDVALHTSIKEQDDHLISQYVSEFNAAVQSGTEML